MIEIWVEKKHYINDKDIIIFIYNYFYQYFFLHLSYVSVRKKKIGYSL